MGWGGSGAAGPRQLLPAAGPSGAAPLTQHPRGQQGRALPLLILRLIPRGGAEDTARCRVPAGVPEGRRSPLRRPGRRCAEVFVGIGARPWEVQSPPEPEPSGPARRARRGRRWDSQ